MRKLYVPIVLALLGLGIALLAIFAPALNLDQSPGWGRLRIASLITGVLAILFSAIYYRFENQFLLSQKFQTTLSKLAFVSWLQSREGISAFVRQCRKYFFILPIVFFILAVYIWFASRGHWTNWDSPTRNYSYLASAFQKGQLYLPVKPDPELLALPNPYDPALRKGVEYPIDYSLYKGKFYLYWGPVPGVLLTMVQPLFHKRIGDLYLVFIFLSGVFCLQVALIVFVWERFFTSLPNRILLITIAVTGLVSPNTMLLNNVINGRIYEAAIFGCQFFLLAGLMAAMIALDRTVPSTWGLAIAGVLWALAVGTRQVLVVSIAIYMLVTLYWLIKAYHLPLPKIILSIASLVTPLVLGAFLLGWYNWSRFGSIFETGYSYQLATPYLQIHLDDLFSPAYILQNLSNYLLAPVDFGVKFPFISLGAAKTTALFSWYSLPDLYDAEPYTGLSYTAPFVFFSVILIFNYLWGVFKGRKLLIEGEQNQNIFAWITISLIGSSMSAFLVLQLYFWMGMRYTADFMPSLILLSVISFWQGYKLLANYRRWRNLYATVGILLAGITIVISTSQAITIILG